MKDLGVRQLEKTREQETHGEAAPLSFAETMAAIILTVVAFMVHFEFQVFPSVPALWSLPRPFGAVPYQKVP